MQIKDQYCAFQPTFEFDKQFSVQKYGKKLVEEDFEFYDNDLVATWKVSCIIY